jgi:hypothetical protein
MLGGKYALYGGRWEECVLNILFMDRGIQAAWDNKRKEWLFCIVDVVRAVTGSKNPRRYWRDLKRKTKLGGFCRRYGKFMRIYLKRADGYGYGLTDFANAKRLLRIIEAVPSPKAKELKMWILSVGRANIEMLPEPLIRLVQYNEENRILRRLELLPCVAPGIAQNLGLSGNPGRALERAAGKWKKWNRETDGDLENAPVRFLAAGRQDFCKWFAVLRLYRLTGRGKLWRRGCSGFAGRGGVCRARGSPTPFAVPTTPFPQANSACL